MPGDTALCADGEQVWGNIQQKSSAGSTIKVIVDQDASTIEFFLDGKPVGDNLTVKPEHKRDLTPAASVQDKGLSLRLVAVEEVAR